MKTISHRVARVLVPALFFFGCGEIYAQTLTETLRKQAELSELEPAIKPQTQIRIGRDTTRLLGPLDEEGYVNFVAALNEKMSQGVTPENNAAVLMLEALGPESLTYLDEQQRVSFYEKLGIHPPPKKEAYFAPLYESCQEFASLESKTPENPSPEKIDQIYALFDRAAERPWRREQYPLVLKWLERNKRSLDRIAEASKRTKYYSPLIKGRDFPPLVLSASSGFSLSLRDASQALTIRALMHAGEGRFDKGREDILTIHRLGTHVSSGPFLIDRVIGFAYSQNAKKAIQNWANHGNLSKTQLVKLQEDLSNLPRLSRPFDTIEVEGGYGFVDLVQTLARGKWDEAWNMHDENGDILASRSAFGFEKKTLARIERTLAADSIDWNECLRTGNRVFDNYGKDWTRADHKERVLLWKRTTEGIEEDYSGIQKAAQGANDAATKAQLAGRGLGLLLTKLCLSGHDTSSFLSVRNKAIHDLTTITLQLALYHQENGKYPDSIEELETMPKNSSRTDPCSGKPYKYRRTKQGYVLYSLGRNGKDDGGRWFLDLEEGQKYKEGEEPDDIGVRVGKVR